MKKILILFLIIFFQYEMANASEFAFDPYRPLWKDFCPSGFEDPQPVDKFYWLSVNRYMKDDMNHFYNVKQSFDKDVAYCDTLDLNFRYICYSKVKERYVDLKINYVTPQEKYRRSLQMYMTGLYFK